jgi:hypothetical protein
MNRLQVIGAYDINEKQIYEGDILAKGSDFFIVIYDGFYCSFGLFPLEFILDMNITDSFYDKYAFTSAEIEEYKIQGNIYDNPELIINAFKS